MKYALIIRGKEHEWRFEVEGRPEYVEEWRADGLIVVEHLGTLPQWWRDLGLPIRLGFWLFS